MRAPLAKPAHDAGIVVNGEALFATLDGALYWPARRTLIVSDLHFEKGSAYAATGQFLPPYDTRATLRRLAGLIDRFAPHAVISLGDAFHDAGAETRMDRADAALLGEMTEAARWIWVLGNHDPAPPRRFAGAAVDRLQMGALSFVHEPAGGAAAGEIAGHLHPCARVAAGQRSIRRRCFASDGARLVMPAFGAYAGGLNVLDPAFAPLFEDFSVFVLGGRGVYPFGRDRLRPDPGGLAGALPAAG